MLFAQRYSGTRSTNVDAAFSCSCMNPQLQSALGIIDEQLVDLLSGKSCGTNRRDELSKQEVVSTKFSSTCFADVVPTRVLRDQNAIEQAVVAHRSHKCHMPIERVSIDAVELNPAPSARRIDVELGILFTLSMNPDECLRVDAKSFKQVELLFRRRTVSSVTRYG